MKRRRTAQSAPARHSLDEGGFFNLRMSIVVLVWALAGCSVLSATLLGFFSPQASSKVSERTLSFAERVNYQRAIEDVYWRRRIWPKENAKPKPSLDEVMSQVQLEKKVTDYLRNSQALANYWQQPLTAVQLQTEMERMAQHTKQPEMLRELFEALGNDPFVIAECLARPMLSERLVTTFHEHHQRSHGELKWTLNGMAAAGASYTLPTISDGAACSDDTWTATSTTNAPSARAGHTAVWTGSEMIVWGGDPGGFTRLNTGARYNPSTDSWTATSTTNARQGRYEHTAVWSGSEMIVWGGFFGGIALNDDGKYNPGTDSWTATSTTSAPSARGFPTSVWTSSEMIIWVDGMT
jgi:hypothetical protein